MSSLSEASNRLYLLQWVQDQVPFLSVLNLTESWCDGIVLCALVETLCPGACPRHDLLKPQNKVNNCRLGLKLAAKHLNVPVVSIIHSIPKRLSLRNKVEREM